MDEPTNDAPINNEFAQAIHKGFARNPNSCDRCSNYLVETMILQGRPLTTNQKLGAQQFWIWLSIDYDAAAAWFESIRPPFD